MPRQRPCQRPRGPLPHATAGGQAEGQCSLGGARAAQLHAGMARSHRDGRSHPPGALLEQVCARVEEAEEWWRGTCVGSQSRCAAPLPGSWRRPPYPEAPNEEGPAGRVQAVSTGTGTQAACGLRGGEPHRHQTMVREGASWRRFHTSVNNRLHHRCQRPGAQRRGWGRYPHALHATPGERWAISGGRGPPFYASTRRGDNDGDAPDDTGG